MIWAHRFLPITDYPDWIFQGSIAAELVQGKAPASYSFKHYPVPNTAAVVLIGALDFVCSPEVSGKVVLSLCIILLALSSTYLLKSITPDANNPLLLIPLLFLPNTFFFWGELDYVLGLSLLFFYCGYLFRRTYRLESINWWLVGGILVALFFCHFLPYATAILVTLALILTESRTELLGPVCICFAPSMVLTVWYAVERVSLNLAGPTWTFWTPHQMAGRWIAAFSPYPEFLPWLAISSPGMKVFALLNLFVAITLTSIVPLAVVLWVRGCTRNRGVLACAVFCALAVIASGYEFEGMISPGERFLYPAVWLGLSWLIGVGVPSERSMLGRGLAVVATSLLACQILYLQINVGAVSNELAALYTRLRSARTQTEFCATYDTYVRQSWDQPHRRCLDVLLTNHASALRLPYYLYLERNVEAPIFQTGILNYTGSGDNEDLCSPR